MSKKFEFGPSYFLLPDSNIRFNRMVRATRTDFQLPGMSYFECDIVLKRDNQNVAQIRIDGSHLELVACDIITHESACATGVRMVKGTKMKFVSWNIKYRGSLVFNGSNTYSILSKLFEKAFNLVAVGGQEAALK